MDEQLLCLVFAVVSLYPVINAQQWQSGKVVAPPATIRVNVDGTRLSPPPAGAAAVQAGLPANIPANPPTLGRILPNPLLAAGGRAPPMAAANGLFTQMFGNGFYDEVWSDRFCGMSRSPMARMFMQESMGNQNYLCNCRMGADTFDFTTVDASPMARRQCMTHVTGVLCCLT